MEVRPSGCGFAKGERKCKNERDCGESKHERLHRSSSVRCGRLDLGLKVLLFSPLPTSPLLFPDASEPCSYPFHHTQPHHGSAPPPSQEARQHEWQAGAGGGIWGLLAKRQTGAAPLESLKWQTLKRVGGETEEDENIPQDEQATILHISPFSHF